jgi:hypothetical protein
MTPPCVAPIVMVGDCVKSDTATSVPPLEAEIEHLHDAVWRDLDVRGLQIAVDDAFLVSGLEGIGDLPSNCERIRNGDRTIEHTIRQCLAFDELEDQGTNPLALFKAMDSADVRVIECREHPRFAFEASEPLRIGREPARQHLDGDVAAEPSVARPIDLAHSAFAE